MLNTDYSGKTRCTCIHRSQSAESMYHTTAVMTVVESVRVEEPYKGLRCDVSCIVVTYAAVKQQLGACIATRAMTLCSATEGHVGCSQLDTVPMHDCFHKLSACQ